MRTLGLIFLAAATTAACGGSSSNTDAPTNHIDSATHDSKSIDGRAIDAPLGLDGPPGTAPLTVKNYLAWCSVTVNNGTASSAASQVVNVAPGTIPLSAVALTGFQLGATPWHDTAGDSGAGDAGTRTGTGQSQSAATTVVVGTSAKCVWVCCETVGTTDCPTTNQCP